MHVSRQVFVLLCMCFLRSQPKFLTHYQHPLCRMGFDSLGREVCVKAVEKKSHEWQILEFLGSPALRPDRANHTIPIVSILHHHDEETVFIVQAKWGTEWLIPNLETMKELYVVTRQLLEGLAFMHRHGVGHGVMLLSLYFNIMILILSYRIFILQTLSGISIIRG